MNARRLVGLLAGVGLAAGIAVVGCTGPDGASGPEGPVGPTGAQGTAGPAGPAGSPGNAAALVEADGGLPTSCLSPCHGFNGIVEQWKTSTHFSTYVSNLGGDEVASWTGQTACGNCHAIDGIETRMSKVVTVSNGAVANQKSGEIGYKNPSSGTYAESMYAGGAKVAAVSCTTCHAVDPATDPHRTGQYAAANFPLRVPTGPNDVAYLEKSPDTTAVTGTPAGKYGASNSCIWCHKSRKDPTNYIGASNTLTSLNWGPHEGPQADVYSGVGGYHYAGKSYGTSTHQAKVTCVDCHMAPVAANGNMPNHSFYPQLSACLGCHAGATSFDVGGGQADVKSSLLELQKALNDAGYLTRSAAAPYVPLTSAQLADGKFELDKTMPSGATLTADQAGAVYNYLLIARGGALGVHNPKYVKQLMFDSIFAIKGVAPTTLNRPQ